jgi:hypothetical protein
MSDRSQPPPGHDSPATYRLTREFFALVAPEHDIDQLGAWELYGILAPHMERWEGWLEEHPDQQLVARYRWEDSRNYGQILRELTGRDDLPGCTGFNDVRRSEGN